MKQPPFARWQVLTGCILALLIAILLGTLAYLHSSKYGLPYRDSFAEGKADEWTALGGTWELVNGTMRNDSGERGAKLLAGSHYWRDYAIDADIYLLGASGDAGLMLRSNDEEKGVNSYNGYYAGLRTLDNSLVFGRAGHDWHEVISPVPGGVRPFHWYHLKFLAYGCQFAVALSNSSQAAPTSISVTDANCLTSGRIGLRSYASGGIWRDVVVRAATHQDLVNMLAVKVADQRGLQDNPTAEDSESARSRQLDFAEIAVADSRKVVQSIGHLRLTSFSTPEIATVRGVVVLAAPRLYLQDSTGGVTVHATNAPLLKVGDEVEVTGESHPGPFSSTLEHATVRVLWEGTPVPPVSITASQAATGRFDAMFVEISGRLLSKQRGSNNTLILDLEEGPQIFRAIMNPGRSDAQFGRLKPDSTLRIRGICVVDPSLTSNLTPFVLLLRSNEDLEVIGGPPWWNTKHIVVLVTIALVLSIVSVSLYHRAENWRLRAILEERERMAHEIHDTLAQSFAGIGFQLQAIRNGITDEMILLRQQIDLASNLVRHSHEEARRSITTMRTANFQSADLLMALEECAQRMVEGGSVRVLTERSGSPNPLPLQITDTLFRIGQEAVANSVRHAQPEVVIIRLLEGEESVRLEVEDNGCGFMLGKAPLGFGIRGMRRRAQWIAANFQLRSTPGEGTRVSVDVPIPPKPTAYHWMKLLWKKRTEQ